MCPRINLDSYTVDQLFLDRPGNDAIQLNLLHNYQSNLALSLIALGSRR